MRTTARYRRLLTAVSLVLTSALIVVWVATQPTFDASGGQLATLEEAGALGTVSQLGYIFSQLPLIIAFLGVAQLMAARAPVWSNITATVGIISGFGHAVSVGSSLILLTMAQDPANRDAYNDLIALFDESAAVIPFMLMGLGGLVLGTICLAIGLWRGRVGPKWVPFVLIAFLLVELVGRGITVWAGLVAALLFLAAFVALAVVVWRSPLEAWGADARVGAPSALALHDAP